MLEMLIKQCKNNVNNIKNNVSVDKECLIN